MHLQSAGLALGVVVVEAVVTTAEVVVAIQPVEEGLAGPLALSLSTHKVVDRGMAM